MVYVVDLHEEEEELKEHWDQYVVCTRLTRPGPGACGSVQRGNSGNLIHTLENMDKLMFSGKLYGMCQID